jgi:predicted Fe-S protein YdhL (DUF1289 family)
VTDGARPRVTAAAQDGVASPCISVCAIDPRTGLCAGCFRSLDEIAGWITLSNDEKRAVVAALPARRRAAGP